MTPGVRRFSRYAPVSGERQPLLLRIASAYFMFSGIAIAINILMATLVGTDLPNGQLSAAQLGVGMAAALLWAGGMVWTGLLLADKSLRGGHFALGFIAFSLLASFNFPRVIFSVASLAILAAIWEHLE